MAQVSASRLRFFLFKQVVSGYLHYHNGQYSRYKEKIGKYETLERQANSQRHNRMEGRRDFRYKILAEYRRKPFYVISYKQPYPSIYDILFRKLRKFT